MATSTGSKAHELRVHKAAFKSFLLAGKSLDLVWLAMLDKEGQILLVN